MTEDEQRDAYFKWAEDVIEGIKIDLAMLPKVPRNIVIVEIHRYLKQDFERLYLESAAEQLGRGGL